MEETADKQKLSQQRRLGAGLCRALSSVGTMELKSPLPQRRIKSSQQIPPLGDPESMIHRGSQEALYFSTPNGMS